MLCQTTLNRDCTVDRVGGARERNEEPVALMADLLTAVFGDE